MFGKSKKKKGIKFYTFTCTGLRCGFGVTGTDEDVVQEIAASHDAKFHRGGREWRQRKPQVL